MASLIHEHVQPCVSPIVHRREVLCDRDTPTETQDRSRLTGCCREVIRAAAGRLKPVGPGSGDDTHSERLLNVFTSIPYSMCGVHALRHRRTVEGKVWGASLVAVGLCAGLFHASKDSRFAARARRFCRKVDYWMVSASTVCLLRACHPVKPPPMLLMAMIPFEPCTMSATNIMAMELEYARRAYTVDSTKKYSACDRAGLKRSFHRQLAAAALGTLCFFAEDAPASGKSLPLVHAGWHCLSAYATAECNALLQHIETTTV